MTAHPWTREDALVRAWDRRRRSPLLRGQDLAHIDGAKCAICGGTGWYERPTKETEDRPLHRQKPVRWCATCHKRWRGKDLRRARRPSLDRLAAERAIGSALDLNRIVGRLPRADFLLHHAYLCEPHPGDPRRTMKPEDVAQWAVLHIPGAWSPSRVREAIRRSRERLREFLEEPSGEEMRDRDPSLDTGDALRIVDVANRLGVSRRHVRKLLDLNELQGFRVSPAPNADWRVWGASLDAFLRRQSESSG